MDEYIKIENVLEALKTISESRPIVCLRSGSFHPFTIALEPGISEMKLKKLTAQIPFSLPEDYLKFLSMTDGLQFLEGEGGYFNSLEEALETTRMFEYRDGIWVIGQIAGMQLIINCNELDSGKYIYVGDATSNCEFISLNTDFTGFLGTFLECNATLYWDWVNYEETRYYDFSKF